MTREEVAAIGLGLATGACSFIAPAVLASTPVLFNDAGRFIVWGAAVGELIADKQPDLGRRTARRGLTLRTLSAARCGYAAAGTWGGALAVAVALPVAFAASAFRRRVSATRCDGYVEDALAIAVATLAAQRLRPSLAARMAGAAPSGATATTTSWCPQISEAVAYMPRARRLAPVHISCYEIN